MPHLEFTLLMAVLLSVAMALLGNRTLRERLYVATYLFLCCALATVAGKNRFGSDFQGRLDRCGIRIRGRWWYGFGLR